MDSTKKLFLTVLSFCSVVYTVSCIFSFTRFLSDFSTNVGLKFNLTTTNLLGDSSVVVPYTAEALVVDTSLLCIFIIVHSSLIPVQEIISTTLKIPVLNKMFYCLLTSASLQLLIRLWMPIPQYTLWTIDTQEATRLRVFLGVHVVSWILIYVMMITMDVTDLLGLKQVYFHLTGRPGSSSLKSEQLKHLHKKMRHPSFLGLAIIFWIYPCMRLDRLLLASVWSLYMLLVWRPDTYSYNYLVQQNIAKRSVL